MCQCIVINLLGDIAIVKNPLDVKEVAYILGDIDYLSFGIEESRLIAKRILKLTEGK